MPKKTLFLALFLLIGALFPLSLFIASGYETYKSRIGGNGRIQEGDPLVSQSLEWTVDGNAICTATLEQRDLQIVSDMNAGAIITWVDRRNGNLDIYAQHIDASGANLWGTNGMVICNYAADQFAPQLVSDGSGGAIIAWQDERPGATEDDIYAQRVNSAGTIMWGANGIPICTTALTQMNPQLVSDSVGGAIIVWAYSSSGIYCQRIDANGNKLWVSSGVLIIGTDFMQYVRNPQLTSDGNQGAIVTCEKDPGIGDYDIYAQHIDSAGTVEWPLEAPICIASNDKTGNRLVSDGEGGAIITWEDPRSGNLNIYAERVDGEGAVLWTTDGVAICTDTADQTNVQLVSDGIGGAIITWCDARGIAPTIYAQRVSAVGNRYWATNGIPISSVSYGVKSPQIASDGNGGAFITWNDTTNIYARRVKSTGTLGWGYTVCSATNQQRMPQITGDGTGGAIIAWQDYRSGSNYDIYAQLVSNSPPTSNHPIDIITSTAGLSTISWNLTDDQGPGEYRVIATDAMGAPYTLVDWTSWTDSAAIEIPISRATMGIFTYTIEYTDDQGIEGTPDNVSVTILPDLVMTILLAAITFALAIIVIGSWRLRRKIAKLEQPLGDQKKVGRDPTDLKGKKPQATQQTKK